jgi:hypothetical protein
LSTTSPSSVSKSSCSRIARAPDGLAEEVFEGDRVAAAKQLERAADQRVRIDVESQRAERCVSDAAGLVCGL